jgi:hypothetical protein
MDVDFGIVANEKSVGQYFSNDGDNNLVYSYDVNDVLDYSSSYFSKLTYIYAKKYNLTPELKNKLDVTNSDMKYLWIDTKCLDLYVFSLELDESNDLYGEASRCVEIFDHNILKLLTSIVEWHLIYYSESTAFHSCIHLHCDASHALQEIKKRMRDPFCRSKGFIASNFLDS